MLRLYAYASDSDLAAVEHDLVSDFKSFAATWGVGAVRLRNTKAPPIPGREDELPDWSIGLSAEVENVTAEQLTSLIAFLAAASKEYSHEFVVGTWNGRDSETEDLLFVTESTSPDTALGLMASLASHPWSRPPVHSSAAQTAITSQFLHVVMTKILFEVDVRRPAALQAKLIEQHPLRAAHGETAFNMCIDDNARHVAYVFLEWDSLASAHRFLKSPASHELVAEWPIEKVLGAIPLRAFNDIHESIKERETG